MSRKCPNHRLQSIRRHLQEETQSTQRHYTIKLKESLISSPERWQTREQQERHEKKPHTHSVKAPRTNFGFRREHFISDMVH